MTIISAYQNGNTFVTLYGDGTKTREYEGVPVPEFPESIDVKITNRCDLGCKYCHESSVGAGAHAKLSLLLRKLRGLPAGTELAIGGGNPLTHPFLFSFLEELKRRGLIANLTVNEGHLKPYRNDIVHLLKDDLIKGLGVSVSEERLWETVPRLYDLCTISPNIVCHVICGVHGIGVVSELLSHVCGCKILVLGYKQHGRGRIYYNPSIETEIKRWSRGIPRYIGKCHLSFDNLAIEQLHIKRLFTEEGWEQFYMGDDGMFSMYIDAVEKVYAPTSRSDERTPWVERSLKDYFTGQRRN